MVGMEKLAPLDPLEPLGLQDQGEGEDRGEILVLGGLQEKLDNKAPQGSLEPMEIQVLQVLLDCLDQLGHLETLYALFSSNTCLFLFLFHWLINCTPT